VQVVSGTLTTTFAYNGDGHRVRKVANGVTTTYVIAVLGLPQVVVETTGGSSTAYLLSCAHCTSYNRFVHSAPQWARLAQVKDGNAEWFLGDALGSVRQLVDDNGDVVLTRDYTPFGQLLSESGTSTSGYAFTGEQWDRDIELLFLRARYYDPAVGRFTSKDPLQIEANLYLYAAANPIRFVDPSGYVYVTFDDGPHQNDAKILDILKSHNARATFFFHGENIDLNDPLDVEIVWRVAAEGSRLGNHAYNHPVGGIPTLCWDETMKSLSDTEYNIKAALLQIKESKPHRYAGLSANVRDYVDNVIEHGTGLFRPPGGDITRRQISNLECTLSIECVVMGCWMVSPNCAEDSGPWEVHRWTVDPQDWWIADQDLPAEMVLDRIKHGWYKWGIFGRIARAITPGRWGSYGVRSNEDDILLHSWSDPTVEALDDILSWLKSKSYTFDLLEPAWVNGSG